MHDITLKVLPVVYGCFVRPVPTNAAPHKIEMYTRRGSSVSEYDTALPQNALLNAWKVAPKNLFSNTSDIILCKC